ARPRCGAGPVEHHETPDPVRSDAVDPRFHCVRDPPPLPGSDPVERHETPDPARLTPWIPGFTASGHPGPECQPNERRTQTQAERNPLIRGKPFLTASNP